MQPVQDPKVQQGVLLDPLVERAARRVGERVADLAEVTEALKRRDALDRAQLRPARDARHLDTRDLTLEEVVAEVLSAIGPL